MAAPTSVRVEATSITSTIIRWTYAGSVALSLYRSTDGSAYTLVTDEILPTATSYEDTGLASNTKYWYKLSDDGGSTFSSVVTVWTHTCGVGFRDDDKSLPRADSEVKAEDFNDLSQKVETRLIAFGDPDGTTCTACIVDGAVDLGCAKYVYCDVIEVEVTEDVNSISMPNCENSEKTINFHIPPNTTRKICGWPRGMGFTGDECFQVPISGGSEGTTVSVSSRQGRANPNSKSRTGYSRTPGTGSGGAGCTCVPSANGGLTIKSCNANNSLNCSGGKSLKLIACGGKGPYTWTKTGTINLSATSGNTTTVTPPTNTGSAVAGNAYRVCYHGESRVNCGAAGSVAHEGALIYGCDDALDSCSTTTGCTSVGLTAAQMRCVQGLSGCDKPQCNSSLGGPGPGGCSAGNAFAGDTADLRSAGMISDGCNPCGINAAGATVTVTDALGVQTTVILRS